MTTADIDPLLAPLSEDAPSGPAIEYDEQYIELERVARGVAQEEDAEGKIVREAKDPEWAEVERIALELAGKSKDLRVALYLARAKLAQSGLPGFRDGLYLIQGYLQNFWPSVHPQLDAAENNDASGRLNALQALYRDDTLFRALRLTPLTQSRRAGRISYRDIMVANGLAPAPTGGDVKPPDAARINEAFSDTPLETLGETQAAANEALDAIAGIEAAIDEALGAGSSPDFTPLTKQLGELKGVLDQEMTKRGGDTAAGENAEAGASPTSDGGATGSLTGAVRNRDDVLLLLDKICQYYSDHEPSSPVPLILNRTKKLVTMNFLDIIKDLAPAGVQEFGIVAGIKEESVGS